MKIDDMKNNIYNNHIIMAKIDEFEEIIQEQEEITEEQEEIIEEEIIEEEIIEDDPTKIKKDTINKNMDDDKDVSDFYLSLPQKKKRKQKPISNEIKQIDDDYSYIELLTFCMDKLKSSNLSSQKDKKFSLPPANVFFSGTKKTIWSNLALTCELLHRPMEHIKLFIFSELGTEGSIDSNKALIIRGRYNPKIIQSLIIKYLENYVKCGNCRGYQTSITRDPISRLSILECDICTSKRTVAPIKRGFEVINRAARKKAKDDKII